MGRDVRFAASRELFRFAKAVAAHQMSVRPGDLPDYEIGRLLGFSRDMTSRFKTGDRSYADALTILRLAETLGISPELLLHVAAGRIKHRKALEQHHADSRADRRQRRRPAASKAR